MSAGQDHMPGRESVFTLAGGQTLGWREYGAPEGDPVIFFHGWPGSSPQGIFLHRTARARGLRILAVDRPGIGKSSRIPHRHFLHVPPLVEELAEHLGLGPCEVLGVSGGGPYALACAWAIPHRVRAAVVCCGAPPLDSPEARRQFHAMYRGLLAIQDRWPSVLRALLTPAITAARFRPPWPVMKLAALALGPRDREAIGDRARFEEFYPSFQHAMRAGTRAVHEDGACYSRPWPFDPAEIRVPVRIWHGSQDTNFHWTLAERLASRIPGAAFFCRDEGHYSLPVFCAEEIVTDMLSVRRA